MNSFWLYQRREDDIWDAVTEDNVSERPGARAGSLHIVDAENRGEALATVISVTEVIERAFVDVEKFGNEYAYHKWFEGGEDNEIGTPLPGSNLSKGCNV